MDKTDAFFYGVFTGIFLLTIIIGLINTWKPTPKAMDVYQGKTTLEYKVVDGVKIDSIVIWKNNIND